MGINVNLSARFKRDYNKMPQEIQDDFDEKIQLFIKNPYNPFLKTHKLRGKLQACLAFCLRDGYRVLFEYSGINQIDLLAIGPHDYYNKWKK